jgi:hypothetical protein
MLLPAKTGSWLKLTILGITVSRYHDFLIAPDALSVITFLGSAAGLARARERLQEYGNSITSPSKALWCDLNRFIPCPFPHGSQYLAAIPVRKVLEPCFRLHQRYGRQQTVDNGFHTAMHLNWDLHRPT